MYVARDVCRVRREVVPEEIADMAAKELTVLRSKIDDYKGLVKSRILPEEPNHADTVNLRAGTRDQILRFYDTLPTVAAVLDQVGGGEDETGYLSFFPGEITIKYTLPGQIVPTHTDTGDEDIDRTAHVLALRGVGSFFIKDPTSSGPGQELEFAAGDEVEFDNPASGVARPPHSALNIGEVERITIGYQVSKSRV